MAYIKHDVGKHAGGLNVKKNEEFWKIRGHTHPYEPSFRGMGVPVPGYGKPLGTSLPAWAHPGYATTRVKPPWYPDLPTQSRRHGRSISSRPDLPTQSRRQSRLIISRLVSCRVPNRTANSNNRISRPIALANSALIARVSLYGPSNKLSFGLLRSKADSNNRV